MKFDLINRIGKKPVEERAEGLDREEINGIKTLTGKKAGIFFAAQIRIVELKRVLEENSLEIAV